MADKYLNGTGVATIRDWAKGLFAKNADLQALDAKVDDIIAEGGEPNVIETVMVNGTALVPTGKAVDVSVPTATSELTNDGDGTSNYVTESYVDTHGGKIDTISVNDTPQTITNKNVNITVPTAVSDLTNDSGFQDETQVQALIDASLADITGIDFQVVTELPATGEHGVIYLVHKGGSGSDIYDEYIWVTPSGGTAHFEQIGTTDIDLSDYWKISDLEAMTVSEINAILNA